MLLKSGAGPNIATDDGQTPVHVAARHGNLTTVDLLLADGGDPINKSNVRKAHNLARWHTKIYIEHSTKSFKLQSANLIYFF